MFLSTAIPLTVIFTSPVLARLNMAQCVPGFDWVRTEFNLSFERGPAADY